MGGGWAAVVPQQVNGPCLLGDRLQGIHSSSTDAAPGACEGRAQPLLLLLQASARRQL
jgi:hypothetical protein